MEPAERREGPRKDGDLVPTVFTHRGKTVSGLAADVSRHGMRMVTTEPWEKLDLTTNEKIEFTIWTPEGFESFIGNVKWVHNELNGSSLGVHVVSRSGQEKQEATA